MAQWKLFKGTREPHDDILKRPEAPPWRSRRAGTYQPTPEEVEVVNAALCLRRPLLVTGKPGSGKSSLAYAVAEELKLGPVLKWGINSRSTLTEGLYQYDAIARLRDANFERSDAAGEPGGAKAEPRPAGASSRRRSQDIGQYIKLGPLGTALLGGMSDSQRPRVLLIDEIDKSDVDLPNDLLHVFEDGYFEIPELTRVADESPQFEIGTADRDGGRVTIRDGRVETSTFPFVLMTSNGERDLPPAFFRRCLRFEIPDATPAQLGSIVRAHLDDAEKHSALIEKLIEEFVERRKEGALATDQLLNAIFLVKEGKIPDKAERERLLDILLAVLTRG